MKLPLDKEEKFNLLVNLTKNKVPKENIDFLCGEVFDIPENYSKYNKININDEIIEGFIFYKRLGGPASLKMAILHDAITLYYTNDNIELEKQRYVRINILKYL